MAELFTHGGAGTLIRRGERLIKEDGFEQHVLSPILETAFQQKLRPAFWDELGDGITIRTETNRAAIMITKKNNTAVMNKFAVTPEARGEGLAKKLFTSALEISSPLIWRARHTNGFNQFYQQHADGFLRRGEWVIFWAGQLDLGTAEILADQLSALPKDFEEISA